MTTSKKKKLLSYAAIVCSITVVIFAALQLFGVWDKAIYVAEPLMGVVLTLRGVQYWQKSKSTAIFLFIAAAILFVVTAVVLFLD